MNFLKDKNFWWALAIFLQLTSTGWLIGNSMGKSEARKECISHLEDIRTNLMR